jgi:hypothetical protein
LAGLRPKSSSTTSQSSSDQLIKKISRAPLSAREIFVYLTAAAANENDDESDDDPPNVVVAEKIAKTVVHNISSD